MYTVTPLGLYVVIIVMMSLIRFIETVKATSDEWHGYFMLYGNRP